MRAEIAIVGGGPAGSAAGRALALAGADVVIFDPSHPREKPCGGGLTGRALRLIGTDVLHRIPTVVVRGARFSSGSFPGGTSTGFLLPEADVLVVASRRALDQALLDAAVAAGARLVTERVADCQAGPAGVTVTTASGRCHEAGFVLGADGVNSLVRRRLRAPFERRQLSLATGFYAYGATGADEISVRCVAAPPGYLWSFPRPDHLAVGICAQADATDSARLRRVVEEWMVQSGCVGDGPLVRYSWPIPSLSRDDFARERPAGPRWMLLGDAAGLVDPLTREGIFYALESGVLAAAALQRGVRPEAAYAERLRDQVFPELARAAALKAGFFTSHFTDLLVEALRRSSKVQAILTGLIAGRQSYRTLKRRLLATHEIGLAWRLLELYVKGRVAVSFRSTHPSP